MYCVPSHHFTLVTTKRPSVCLVSLVTYISLHCQTCELSIHFFWPLVNHLGVSDDCNFQLLELYRGTHVDVITELTLYSIINQADCQQFPCWWRGALPARPLTSTVLQLKLYLMVFFFETCQQGNNVIKCNFDMGKSKFYPGDVVIAVSWWSQEKCVSSQRLFASSTQE